MSGGEVIPILGAISTTPERGASDVRHLTDDELTAFAIDVAIDTLAQDAKRLSLDPEGAEDSAYMRGLLVDLRDRTR